MYYMNKHRPARICSSFLLDSLLQTKVLSRRFLILSKETDASVYTCTYKNFKADKNLEQCLNHAYYKMGFLKYNGSFNKMGLLIKKNFCKSIRTKED